MPPTSEFMGDNDIGDTAEPAVPCPLSGTPIPANDIGEIPDPTGLTGTPPNDPGPYGDVCCIADSGSGRGRSATWTSGGTLDMWGGGVLEGVARTWPGEAPAAILRLDPDDPAGIPIER